jgi:hypothetical protein
VIRLTSSLLAIAGALVVTAAPVRAPAQPNTTERALATALFNEGRALMAEKRWAEACPKLAESQSLDPGGGTLLNLAICHEEAGETATAWAELNDALAIALREDRADREDIARAHIAALEPRLARLQVRVKVETAPADLEVTLDGAPLRRVAWGTAVPVNPGAHALIARAAGRVAWTGSAEAAPGTVVAVDVPVLALAPIRPALPAATTRRPPAERPRDPASTRRTIGWVVGGVGLTALLVGAGSGVVAIVEANKAADDCGPETCPKGNALQESKDHTSTADAAAIVANITIPAGAAVTALGVILVLTSPSPKTRPAVRASAWLGAGRIELCGVF